MCIESPSDLAKVQHEVLDDLATYGASLLVGVLLAGMVLILVVVLSDVLLHQADLGGRRALGASRTLIIVLVVGKAGLCALIGSILGVIGGGVYLVIVMNYLIPLPFALGMAVLAVLEASCSAVPPAIAASIQDPVRVLRTA